MKSKILTAATALFCTAAIAAPFALTYSLTAGFPAQYDESFFAGLKLKRDRLRSIEGEKLVLIGGSNLAFGVDSALLEEYVGLPVVNFGLYAALGTKAMLDMAKPFIGEGDIVVICPEQDAQTYSLYYSGLNMWYALDSDYSMLSDVGLANLDELLAALPEFASEKRETAKSASSAQSGIYALASLNEYGDIAVERPYNTMIDFGRSLTAALDTTLLDGEFIDYLNDFAQDVERRGARVWFGFSPLNREAVTSGEEEIEEFYRTLGERLDFPIISDLDDYLLDAGYFFDTNYHMNSVGMQYRTALLARDINRELGSGATISLRAFSPPERPEDWIVVDSAEDDEANAAYFRFEPTDGGAVVVGLTEAGLKEKRLVLPNICDSKAVIEIAPEAFADSDVLEELVVPSTSPLRKLSERAFAGCETLVRIELGVEPSTLAATELTFEGASDDCRVYVSGELYGAYASDYFWSGMMDRVELAE